MARATLTVDKRLRVGDEVLVVGHEDDGSRRIVELYDQSTTPGGVKLDRPVDLFRSWNEDALMLVIST